MESRNSLVLLLVIMAGFLYSSQAYNFYVGGKDGWVLKPSESYVQWSQRNRFQISDSLVFKYNKESDSVLVVTKQDFDTCNVSNPILKLEGGDSSYKFARSGIFYFITGNQSNCQNGQKLSTVVITPRTPRTPPNAIPPSSTSTAPSGPPGGTAPPTPPSTVPSIAPVTTTPGAPSIVPSTAPISSPPEGSTTASPASSPSIVPSSAPTSSISSPPEGSPFASPPSPPFMVPSSSPGMVPSSSPGSGPSAVPAPAGGPGGSGDSIAPKPASSAHAILSSNKFVLGLSLLVTVALQRSVVSF